MRINIGKIVGIPTATAWAQVVAIKPEVLPQRVRSQPFFAAVSLETREDPAYRRAGPACRQAGMETAVVGKEVLAALEEEFFRKNKQTVFEAFARSCRVSLEKVKESLKEGVEVEFNLVAASLDEEVLHLAQIGDGQIWLWRKGNLGPIFDKPTEEFKQASGNVFSGDILVLATPLFWEKITEGELKAVLAGGEVGEAMEGLAPKVHGLESSAAVAALFVKFEEEVEEKKGPAKSARGGSGGKEKKEEVRLRPRVKPIFIRGPEVEAKRKRKVLIGALFLTLLLSLSVVKGVTKRGFLGRRTSFEDLVSQIQEKIEEADDFSSLNPKRANESLIEAQEILVKMRDLKIGSDEVKKLEQEITRKQKEILRVQEIEAPELVFDLSLIKPQVEGVSLSFVENEVLVLSSGSIFAVDPERKKGEMILAGEEFSDALFFSDNFVFGKEGIFKIDAEEKTTAKVVEKEEGWSEVKGFSTYLENLYLLDTSANQIKKYTATASGYLPPQDYLTDVADFSDAVDIAIDGLIYVLEKNGNILKYLQGKKEYFQASGLDKSFSKTTVFYTDADLDDLYVLDKDNKRIVVLEKTGEYKAQYISEVLGEAGDFIVDSEKEVIYVLAGSKIYKINV